MKPRILVSFLTNWQFYLDAVNAAGGDPTGAYMPVYDDKYAGLILCGGVDIDPAFYGEPVNGAVGIDPARDEAELELTERFIRAGKPILGVCRGIQLLNVYFGGTLEQDIPRHAHYNAAVDVLHETNVSEGNALYTLYGAHPTVNSFHHQRIDKLAADLQVIQRCAADDTIEGVLHPTLPILGVQWHPEKMIDPADERVANGKALFEYFVSICR